MRLAFATLAANAPVVAHAQAAARAQLAADSPAEVITLAYATCGVDALDGRELLENLSVELAPTLVTFVEAPDAPTGDADAAPALWVRACADEPAQIGVVQGGLLSSQQAVDLSDSPPEMRCRTLALALAEYYRTRQRAAVQTESALPSDAVPAPQSVESGASTAAVSDAPNTAVGSAPPIEGTRRTTAPARRTPSLGWFAGPSVRGLPSVGTWLAGAEAGVSVGRLRLGFSYLAHHRSIQVGSITLGSAAMLASYQPWRIGRTPAIGLRLRAELGGTYAVGHATDGGSDSDKLVPQTAILIEVPLSMPLGETLRAELVPAFGSATGLQVNAGARLLATTRGVFIGLSLLLGFSR